MRGIDTPIRQIRRRVFEEVARVAFESDNLNDDIQRESYCVRAGKAGHGTFPAAG